MQKFTLTLSGAFKPQEFYFLSQFYFSEKKNVNKEMGKSES